MESLREDLDDLEEKFEHMVHAQAELEENCAVLTATTRKQRAELIAMQSLPETDAQRERRVENDLRKEAAAVLVSRLRSELEATHGEIQVLERQLEVQQENEKITQENFLKLQAELVSTLDRVAAREVAVAKLEEELRRWSQPPPPPRVSRRKPQASNELNRFMDLFQA